MPQVEPIIPSVERRPRTPLPSGRWTRGDHFPDPLAPLDGDLSFGTGFDPPAGMAELFPTLPSRTMILIDGYAYSGGTEPPPNPTPAQVTLFEQRIHDGHESEMLRRWNEDTRPFLRSHLEAAQAVALDSLDDAGLLDHLATLTRLFAVASTAHFGDHAAAGLVLGRAFTYLHELSGLENDDFLELLAGHSSASSEPIAELEQIAVRALAEPDVAAAILSPNVHLDLRVQALLAPWLARYGARALDYILIGPTLAEQPALAGRLLQDAAARVRTASGAATRVDPAEGWRSQLPESERAEFNRVLGEARAAYGVREDDISFSQWVRGLRRYVALEAGRRLAGRGLIADSDAVWYIFGPELERALTDGSAPDSTVLAERRAEHERQLRENPPPQVIGSPPTLPNELPMSPEAQAAMQALAWYGRVSSPIRGNDTGEARRLRGTPASRGVYTGPVRMVLSESEFDRVEPGDVIVCRGTTPAWSVLFGMAGAVVCDEGGALSHAGIAAREFGIAAVTGSRTATSRLHEGQTVTVDGGAGVISW